jgi:SAM-dependent methyltransferase
LSEATSGDTSLGPLHHDRYVRSNSYDPQWVLDNQMGPNALWLMEALCEKLPLARGARVLDLGCGKAMTSIFLAREFGAEVWATDLWIDASSNRERIFEAGVHEQVTPVHAEAHMLPFDEGFFDAIVSVDAYQYFGTSDLYIGYITRFLRDGGQIGIVVPAVFEELDLAIGVGGPAGGVPKELAPYWDWEFCCFHGPQWWRRHWEKTDMVRVEVADAIDDGWKDWLRFCEVSLDGLDGSGGGLEGWREQAAQNEVTMLGLDKGRLFGFTRVVGSKGPPLQGVARALPPGS